MPDAAISKVEDAIAAQIAAYGSLTGWTVIADQSDDISLAEGSDKTILLRTLEHKHVQSDELNQTLHTAIIEIEAVQQMQTSGSISRANRTALAHVLAAIAADRTIGGRMQDIQEMDSAPAGATGVDVAGASIQFVAEFFTPRGDWFTILGQAGQQF